MTDDVRIAIRGSGDSLAAIDQAVASIGLVVRPGTRVFLKPNLTFPRHVPGVTTRPSFIEAAIRYFLDHRAKVTVGEGDGGYGQYAADVAFRGHGLPEICAKAGASLVNLSSVATIGCPTSVPQIDRLELPALLLDETDLFVSLPVPKVHSNTIYSGAVKNQWGCIPDAMRLRLHPYFVPLVWDVNELLRPRLILGDASYILDRSGPLVGDPVYMDRVISSNGLLAFDVHVAGSIMNLPVGAISHLSEGLRRGYPAEVDAIDDPDRDARPRHTFVLRRTMRTWVTAKAFPRKWAVELLWFSWFGVLLHHILYLVKRNPIAEAKNTLQLDDEPNNQR